MFLSALDQQPSPRLCVWADEGDLTPDCVGKGSCITSLGGATSTVAVMLL